MQKGSFSILTVPIFFLCCLICLPGARAQSLNPEFKPELPTDWSKVGSVAVQSDGQILVATDETSPSNESIIRLNPDGRKDQSFKSEIGFPGKIVLSGAKILVLGSTAARLNMDGSLDQSFKSPDIRRFAGSGTVQADGKLLLTGTFNSVNDVARSCVARLNANGQLDDTYSPSTEAHNALGILGRAVALQKDGRAIFAGQYPFANGFAYLARLNHDGSRDETFNVPTGLVNNPNLVVVQPDDKIIVGSSISYSEYQLIRLNGDGTLDSTFQTVIVQLSSGIPTVNSLLLLPSGKILVGGNFSNINETPAAYLVQLNPDGSLDGSFKTSLPNGPVRNIALKGHCEVVVSGDFTEVANQAAEGLASLYLPSPEAHCHLERLGGKVMLHFIGETGKTYRVEKSTDLVQWSSYSETAYEGSSFTLALGGANQFYRAIAQ